MKLSAPFFEGTTLGTQQNRETLCRTSNGPGVFLGQVTV